MDRDLNHQFDVPNNLNPEKIQTKAKSNHSNMKQKELSELRSYETIVIKPSDKRRIKVVLSTAHFMHDAMSIGLK